MQEFVSEESWALKNWCFWTVVLEKTIESPLDCKEIQPVHNKGDQSWVFTGGTDVEAETPILWPPHAKCWLIGKDSDAGRDWGQEEKGTTGDEMAGWHHRLDGHEFGWTPGVGDGQRGLACCNSWGLKESDTTKLLNWTEGTCYLPEKQEIKVCFLSHPVCGNLPLKPTLTKTGGRGQMGGKEWDREECTHMWWTLRITNNKLSENTTIIHFTASCKNINIAHNIEINTVKYQIKEHCFCIFPILWGKNILV